MKKIRKAGVIGRFKPLHNGGALMLETICKKAEHVVIGIGSCNKYNMRNPFTAKESEDMVRKYLSGFSNYEIVYIPDYAHNPEYRDGKRWKKEVIKKFGKLDAFISGNEWTAKLLSDTYKIIHPADLIQREKWIMLRATQVRVEIAQGKEWQRLVPEEIAKYIQENKLDERFRKEFGLQTLSQILDGVDYTMPEDAWAERQHTYEK